jgi:hypothetical protein
MLLAKLIRLSRAQWAELLRVQWGLIYGRLLISLRPPGELMAPAAELGPEEGARGDIDDAVRQMAQAVERVAAYGLFRPTCLVQAVALHRLIRSRGFSGSSVRVGIRVQNGQLLAHAWVDYRGAVLGDRDWHVRKFEELARMEMRRRP